MRNYHGPMKEVTLTVDEFPHRAGEKLLLPYKLADETVAEGRAKDAEWFGTLRPTPTITERIVSTVRSITQPQPTLTLKGKQGVRGVS